MLQNSEDNIEKASYAEEEGLALPAQDPIDELLESRFVARDFEVEGGTVRVETRIRLSHNPWSVSSVVLENGVEVRDGPFAPLHDEVDTNSFDPDAFEDLRRELASRVFEIHNSRCRNVERALSGKPTSTGGRSKTLGVTLVLILLLGSLAGAGYYLWSRKPFRAATLDEVEGFVESQPSEHEGSEQSEAASDPADTEPALSPPAFRPDPPSFEGPAAPDDEPSRLPQQSREKAAEPRRPPSPGATRRPAQAPQPLPPAQDETLEVAPVETPPEPLTAVQASASELEPRVSTLITQLRPPHYRLGSLSPGAFAFSDHDAVFTSVPQSQLNLPCIRPSIKDRAAEDVHVTFLLGSAARVFVGHDSRIRKKPEWLASFTPAGHSWEVAGVGPAEETTAYEVFVRSFSAGTVRLGPNIQWTGLTRRWRDTFPKELAMYLICVETD